MKAMKEHRLTRQRKIIKLFILIVHDLITIDIIPPVDNTSNSNKHILKLYLYKTDDQMINELMMNELMDTMLAKVKKLFNKMLCYNSIESAWLYCGCITT